MDPRRRKFYSALRDELRAFAQKTFYLGAPNKDGATPRQIFGGLIERTKRPESLAEYEAELECPPFPEPLGYIWVVFNRLSARRGSNGFSLNPISWPDIDAFMRLSGFRLVPWEIQMVEELDDLYRSEIAKASQSQ